MVRDPTLPSIAYFHLAAVLNKHMHLIISTGKKAAPEIIFRGTKKITILAELKRCVVGGRETFAPTRIHLRLCSTESDLQGGTRGLWRRSWREIRVLYDTRVEAKSDSQFSFRVRACFV